MSADRSRQTQARLQMQRERYRYLEGTSDLRILATSCPRDLALAQPGRGEDGPFS